MTRLAELQCVTDSGNDIRQSSGRENHCWNNVSIQESHLEYKNKSAMDPRRLRKNASVENGPRRKSTELLKKGDLRRNGKKENDLAGNQRKRPHTSYVSESTKKMRKSAVSPHTPTTTIPNSHILVKGSSRIFPFESPDNLQSSRLTKMKRESPANNLASSIVNGGTTKPGVRTTRVKTTQELIEDLLAKKKSQFFSITSKYGNYQVTSPTNSVSSDSELPKTETCLEAYSIRSPTEQNLSKPSSTNRNIRRKKIKLAQAKTITQQFIDNHLPNDQSSCNLSLIRHSSDPESRPDKGLVTELPKAQIESTRALRSESAKMATPPFVNCEDTGILLLSTNPEDAVPPKSVIVHDTDDNVSFIDVESIGNDDCEFNGSPVDHGGTPQFDDGTDAPQSHASATSPPAYHDPDPEHQDGIYGNHDAQGVWHPWQDWYDVHHSPDITVRILPYVMLD